jgi:hypothetical protein
MLVPSVEKRLDGRLQIGHAEEDSAPDGFVVQVAEPSLDKIHPTGTGGDEVRNEPRMTFQPRFYCGVFVRSVVVQDQVQRDVAAELGVEPAQKSQELLMPVSGMAFANDPSLERLQSGEQGGRAMAFVIVGSWFRNAPS